MHQMIFKRELGEKGQVVIPKDIRLHLGLQKGRSVIFSVRGSEVVLTNEQSETDFLREFFDTPKLKKRLSSKELKQNMLVQYEERLPRH